MAYILYIAKDKADPTRHDLGSVLCLQQLEKLPANFVEVNECSPTNHPDDIKGTPTLRSIQHGTFYTGNQALQHLSTMSVSFAEKKGRAQMMEEYQEQQKRARPRRPPPTSSFPPRAPPTMNTQLRPEQPRVREENDEDEERGGTGGVEKLFESQLNDEDMEDDDEVDSSTRKITSDDLSRHNQSRDQHHIQQTPQHQPPPLPPLNG